MRPGVRLIWAHQVQGIAVRGSISESDIYGRRIGARHVSMVWFQSSSIVHLGCKK